MSAFTRKADIDRQLFDGSFVPGADIASGSLPERHAIKWKWFSIDFDYLIGVLSRGVSYRALQIAEAGADD